MLLSNLSLESLLILGPGVHEAELLKGPCPRTMNESQEQLQWPRTFAKN
jgi:hypothetical protein